MRSQNEVIQVRCVELKLKVNNNHDNEQQQQRETRETEHRDKKEKTHRERADLFCRLTGRPLSCCAVSRSHQWFPLPQNQTRRPFRCVTTVAPWHAVMLIKALGSTVIPVGAG